MPPGMRYAPTCDKVANTLLYCGVMLRKAKAVGSVLTLKIYRALNLQGLVLSGIKLAIMYGGTTLDNLVFHATASHETAVLNGLNGFFLSICLSSLGTSS